MCTVQALVARRQGGRARRETALVPGCGRPITRHEPEFWSTSSQVHVWLTLNCSLVLCFRLWARVLARVSSFVCSRALSRASVLAFTACIYSADRHAWSRGPLREYDFRRVPLEPREALTHAKERSAGLSLCSRKAVGSAASALPQVVSRRPRLAGGSAPVRVLHYEHGAGSPSPAAAPTGAPHQEWPS